MYIPTEIHSQLKSYSVSCCSVCLSVVLMSIGGTTAESFSRFLRAVAEEAAAILATVCRLFTRWRHPHKVCKNQYVKNSNSHYNSLVVSVFRWVCTCRVVYFGVFRCFKCISVYFGVYTDRLSGVYARGSTGTKRSHTGGKILKCVTCCGLHRPL